MPVFLCLMLISQQVYELDEVIVTANRYPAMLKDVAVAVMIIERNDIERMNALTIGEVLNAAAGMDIKDYGTAGVTSISTRGIPANGTLVLINGQPINAITNGIADLSVIDIHTIQRIEIVKGPVSSIYGPNALGGVVNIITTRSSTKPEGEFGFLPSTTSFRAPFRATDLFLKLAWPLSKTQFNMAGAYTNDGGDRSNSDLSKYHLTGAIAHNSRRFSIRSSILYDNKEYGVPGPLPFIDDTHPVPLFGDSTATSLFDRQDDCTFLGNISMDLRISDNISHYAKLFANRQRTRFHTVYAGIMGDTVTEDYDYLVHKLGVNTLIKLRTGVLDYALGLDATYDTLHTGVTSTVLNDTNWQASSYGFGSWGELAMHVNDRVTWNASIRYDFNSQFGGFLSPSIGLVSVLYPRLWLKLSAGKTFRAPTFNDLYWPEYGNPGLQPEHGWAYEARVESSPRSNLYGAVSLFIRNVDDRITWLPQQDNTWRPQNVNLLSVRGFDIELKHYIHESIDYEINATYLNGQQRNDEIVYSFYDWYADTGLTIIEEVERKAAFMPRYTISSQVNFSLPHNIRINLGGQYLSERINYYSNYENYPTVTMDEKILKSYIVINSVMNMDVSSYFNLSFGIKNVFDAAYATQFGNNMLDLDYPMPGRTFFARFSLRFVR